MALLISKRYLIAIILIAIILFHFFNNFMWLSKDNSIDGVDSNWHLIEAFKFHLVFKKILQAHSSLFVKIEQVFYAFRNWGTLNWPPLIYFLSALISPDEFNIFPPRMYINFIFYIFLILFTYFLGKKCFNRKVGLIASFLISFYPAVCAFSRQFGLDFPLLSLTAMCVCLFVYTEGFYNRRYSLLFGLGMGVATLIKLQIMFFLLASLLYGIFNALRQKNDTKFYIFSNLILSFILAFLFFYLYWGNRLGRIFLDFYEATFFLYPFYSSKNTPILGTIIPLEAAIPIFSLRNMIFYLEGLLFQVSLYPFILFICALSLFLVRRNRWRTFFLLNLIIPYFIFTFISVKWTRYAMPMLIFMAIISAWFIDSLKIKYLKAIVLCVLIFYCLHICILNSWILNDYRPIARFYKPTMNFKDWNSPRIYPPSLYNYTAKLKKKGIIPSIQRHLSEGKVIKIEFSEDSMGDVIVQLYLYFQDAIFNNMIDVQRKPKTDFQDADYIVMKSYDLPNNKDLLKKYKIFSIIEKNIFLIKNEKNSLI